MANERVSQLIDLLASDLRSEDLFLVTDMSQRESKKLELGQLLLFIESSGSFSAYTSAQASTASYIRASNIDGAPALALLASQSISSSYADKALTSSYAVSASWAPPVPTVSASFADRSGRADTASYSNVSSLATAAATAYNLFYNGTPNGTASWAIRADRSTTVDTASYCNNLQVWYPHSDQSQYGYINIYGAVNDGVTFLMSGSTDGGTCYFRTHDNGTEPFMFQSQDSNGGASPVNRMSLNYTSASGNTSLLTVYGTISASRFTSSKSHGVGFDGTASFALTASSVPAGNFGPTFISPITVVSTTLSTSFTTFDAAPYVPAGTRVVLLDCWVDNSTTNNLSWIYIRKDSSSSQYVLTSYKSGGGGDIVSVGGQGSFPVNTSQTFQYGITSAASAIVVRLIGYY